MRNGSKLLRLKPLIRIVFPDTKGFNFFRLEPLSRSAYHHLHVQNSSNFLWSRDSLGSISGHETVLTWPGFDHGRFELCFFKHATALFGVNQSRQSSWLHFEIFHCISSRVFFLFDVNLTPFLQDVSSVLWKIVVTLEILVPSPYSLLIAINRELSKYRVVNYLDRIHMVPSYTYWNKDNYHLEYIFFNWNGYFDDCDSSGIGLTLFSV